MSQGCTVCQRPDIAAINTALRQGTPVRAVARQFTIAKTTMLRHSEHVPHVAKGDQPMPTETLTESPSPALLEARLAGMSREVTLLRTEVERLTQQHASDHGFIACLAELVYIVATDDGSRQKIFETFHQSANPRDPLLQLLRQLTHQPVLPAYGERTPRPMPPLDRPTPGTPWWHVLAVLGKSHTANEKEAD